MSKNAIPYELMPLAAALLSVCLLTLGRAVYLSFFAPTPKRTTASSRTSGSATASSSPRLFYIVALAALIAYSYTVGRIQGAILKQEHASFDPYAILHITKPVDTVDYTAKITAAYRDLVKQVHPSNGGSHERFEQVVWAYRALTEDAAMQQFQQHGHPEGPLLTPVFTLQFPSWLCIWQEQVATRMMLTYASIVLLVVGLALLNHRRNKSAADGDDINEQDFAAMQNQVVQQDLQHLAKHLRLDLTHQQVLYVALSAPQMMVQWAAIDLKRIDKLRVERGAQLETERTKTQSANAWDELLANDDGWADDNDDDDDDDENDSDELRAARQAAKEQQKQLEKQKQAAAVKPPMLLEGVDEGVVGQAWVQQNLIKAKLWPPTDVASLESMTSADPLDDPALTRILCMLTGRLHSEFLNTHKELLAAAAAGPPPKIDQTYFGANVMFRHRMRLLLEAIIRLATTLRCAKLLQTTLEAVAIFSIGCQAHETEKYRNQLQRTMNCIPQLQVQSDPAPTVRTPEESDIVAGDAGTALQFAVDRTHAKPMLAAKVAQWQKQGIPLEIALQTFREVWWVIVQCERLDDDGSTRWYNHIDRKDPLLAQLEIDSNKIDLFEQRQESRREFLCARPLVVANPSQGLIHGKILFEAPSEPGQYRFTVELKSHEFLGCDTEFSVDATILSPTKAGRAAREAPVDEAGEEQEETHDDAESSDAAGKKDQ